MKLFRILRNGLIWAASVHVATAMLGIPLTWQLIVLVVGTGIIDDMLKYFLPVSGQRA